ncbi:MAG: hypothetical protein WCQ89_07790 [Verrucomicrobiota bacterium]
MKPQLTLPTGQLLASLVALLWLAASVSAEDGVDTRHPKLSITAEHAHSTLP